MAKKRKGYAAQIAELERSGNLEQALENTSYQPVKKKKKKISEKKSGNKIYEFLMGEHAYSQKYKDLPAKLKKRRMQRRSQYQ